MSSTIHLVKRGASLSSSPSTSLRCRLIRLHSTSACVSISTTISVPRSARSRHDSGTTSTVFMDPKRTRHWIRSFHRMTLNPHLFPPASKSRQHHHQQQPHSTRHAPLFARESGVNGGRRPLTGPRKDYLGAAVSPSYRLIEEAETPSHPVILGDFDPFMNSTKSKKGRRFRSVSSQVDGIDRDDLSSTLNFWTINSLPLTPTHRPELLRMGARADYSTEPAVSIDDDVFHRHGQLMDERIEAASSIFLSSTEYNPGLSWKASSSDLEQASFQAPSADNLIEKMKSRTQALTGSELQTELQDIGKAVLLNLGLPRDFVEANSNQQDVVGTGLDAVLMSLPPSIANPWANSFFSQIQSFDLLRLAEPQSLQRLQSCLLADSSSCGALSETVTGKDDWRVQSRRFRMQVAISRETGTIPNKIDYEKFMNVCLKASRYQEVELAFHHYMDHSQPESPSKPSTPSLGMYRQLIQGLVRQGRMDHAQEVFHGMRRKGVQPSIVIFGSMLEGYGRQMDLRKMGWMLRMMHAAGLAPTLPIYTSLMANYIRAGELGRASEVRRQLLERQDLELDRESKNVMSHLARLQSGEITPVHSRASRLFQNTFVAWKDQVATSSNEQTEETPLRLEELNRVIEINHRLKGCLESNNTIKFEKTFKEFGKQDLWPNTFSFNILIDSLVRSRHTRDALQVLTHMKTMPHGKARPDVVTYSTLLQGAVEEKRVDLGWSLYQEMMELSIRPTLHTYSTLFELVNKDPRNELGRAVVRDQAALGSRPVLRFPIQTRTEETMGLNFACALYDQLCFQGLKPNQHIFGVLLNMAARDGQMDLAEMIYQEMIFKSVEPNSVILTTLLKGFTVQRDFESGWKIWQHMLETDMPRNAITYHHLIRLCERSLPNAQVIVVETKEKDPFHGPLEPGLDDGDLCEESSESEILVRSADGIDLQPKTKGTTYKMRRRQQKQEREEAAMNLLQIESETKKQFQQVLKDVQDRRSVMDLFLAPTSAKATSPTTTATTPELSDLATVRIPIQIWYDIQDQMRLDRVQWSRVQAFRRRDVDRAVWKPVAEEAGPVISTGRAIATATAALARDNRDLEAGASLEEDEKEDRTFGVDESRFVGLSQSSLSAGRKIYGSKGGAAALQASAFVLGEAEDETKSLESSPEIVTPMIQEYFSGGGDGYQPKRRPAKGKALRWDDSRKSPTIRGHGGDSRLDGNDRSWRMKRSVDQKWKELGRSKP